jgi:4-oxalocrotonate tautomerase
MLSGRTANQKREMMAVISRETARIAKCAIENVQVVIAEIDHEHWATGDVMASEPRPT